MLALDAVSYRYAGAERPSLRGVSLDLRRGRVLGLVGPSEAGKTTVCLVASGLAPRTVGGTLRGRLLLDGEDAAALAIHELAGRVGIVFSSPATQLSGVAETVYEEVAFGPMNMGLGRTEIVDRTEAALAALRISDLAARDPSRLSGGQQQLVAIAGLLALRPAYVVLDEPTAQLDPAGTRLVATALQRLAGDNAAILIAEQKTDLLADLCTEVAVIDAGKVAFRGPTADVLADPRLAELGVASPAAVRLARAAVAAGLDAARQTRLASATRAAGA